MTAPKTDTTPDTDIDARERELMLKLGECLRNDESPFQTIKSALLEYRKQIQDRSAKLVTCPDCGWIHSSKHGKHDCEISRMYGNARYV